MNTGSVVPPDAYPVENSPNYAVGSYPVPFEESVWTRRGTWGSVVVGALVGFAITVIMATFGAAAGLTAGAVAADQASEEGRMGAGDRQERDVNRYEGAATRQEKEDVAKGSAAGGAVWLVLTAILAGIIGGWVAGRIAQVYRADIPILGLSTWAVGMIIMVALAAFGAAGMLGGLGAGAGEAAQSAGPVDSEAAKTAATAATIAVWGFFVAQLLGLGATMLGAKLGMNRRLKLYPRTATP